MTQNTSETVPVVLMTPYIDLIKLVRQKMDENKRLTILEATRGTGANTLRQEFPCVVVASIRDNSDIAMITNLLKIFGPDQKRGLVSFIIASQIDNPGIRDIFRRLGCVEFYTPVVRVDVIQNRILDLARELRATRKRLEKMINESSQAKPVANPKVSSDVFVFRKTDAKKIGANWVIHMSGPDQTAVQWNMMTDNDSQTEQPGKPQGKQKIPRWKLLSSKSSGTWQWYGDKPTYEAGNWVFKSEKPELSLVDDEGTTLTKQVSLDNDKIVFSEPEEKIEKLYTIIALTVMLSDLLFKKSSSQQICDDLSKKLGGALITLWQVTSLRKPDALEASSVFTSDGIAKANVDLTASDGKKLFVKALESRTAVSSEDGRSIYSPIYFNCVKKKRLLGFLVLNSLKHTVDGPIDPQYIYKLGQILRGQLY